MKTAWKILIGVLAALLILLLVAEAGLRIFLSKQIENGYEAQYASSSQVVAGKPDVSFGPQPLTIGLLGGALPHLTLKTPSTLSISEGDITGEPAATVEMDKVRLINQEPVADQLRMRADLPSEYLQAVINQAIDQQLGNNAFLDNLITVSAVTTNPAHDTFTVSFTRGVANVEIHPVRTPDGVTFETAGTQLFGFDLPSDVADAITTSLQEGIATQEMGSMQLSDILVTPTGLTMEVTGSNVNFYELQRTSAATPASAPSLSAP